jgi:hypothetical protein
MAAKETYHVVTTDGDDHELRTLPAAWLLLTELNVAGRIDRVATEGMNEPGRVTVASRTPEDGWTLHPGAQGPATRTKKPAGQTWYNEGRGG